ncbi:hypothetical protein [Streptomyces sp. NPDC102490]
MTSGLRISWGTEIRSGRLGTSKRGEPSPRTELEARRRPWHAHHGSGNT